MRSESFATGNPSCASPRKRKSSHRPFAGSIRISCATPLAVAASPGTITPWVVSSSSPPSRPQLAEPASA